MAKRAAWSIAAALFLQFATGIVGAQADDGVQQYKAAVTKIFLGLYGAFPIYYTNPIFPGDIVSMEKEGIKKRGCYKNQINGNYVAINGFMTGLNVGRGIAAEVSGELLSKRIAGLEAGGKVTVDYQMKMTVSPLSVDRPDPDQSSLNKWNKADRDCQMIGDLLVGRTGGYFLVSEVLHGRRNEWVERLVSGEQMVSANEVNREQLNAAATYGAAMEIAKSAI